ncbi:hypothetical protein HFP89_04590 [Wenzhouxiangella sp. XN79A]|uniref:hypothetical protein n=1 Tax=Wenzhouxiangella sp. XN79A TaxID=2724193 RepID=UPI00144A79FE|nr:hypothetical protein [Wenzhouxiangella sp. XN79A]NKI34439.1 hypothetical protein [Wenzhouxiangella sp. XN79A]
MISMVGKLKQRAETGVLATALVIPLALCVFAFLGVAGYFTFRESLPPNLAALVTAACGIVLIALVLIGAKLANRTRSTPPPSQSDFELGEELESYLREHADPVLSDWVRDHPDRAALVSLALGVAAGYSGRFRSVLMDMYARYSETERARRDRTR